LDTLHRLDNLRFFGHCGTTGTTTTPHGLAKCVPKVLKRIPILFVCLFVCFWPESGLGTSVKQTRQKQWVMSNEGPLKKKTIIMRLSKKMI